MICVKTWSLFCPFIFKVKHNTCYLFHFSINCFFLFFKVFICLPQRVILYLEVSILLVWRFLLRCKLFLIFDLKICNLFVMRNQKICNLIVIRDLYSCNKLKKVIRLGVWLFFFIELGLDVANRSNLPLIFCHPYHLGNASFVVEKLQVQRLFFIFKLFDGF